MQMFYIVHGFGMMLCSGEKLKTGNWKVSSSIHAKNEPWTNDLE